MRRTFKKSFATLMTIAAMTASVAGMNANAAGVTATKTFYVNGYGATATLYRDKNKSSATTSLNPAVEVTVQITVNSSSAFDSDKTYASVTSSGSTSKAYSYHTASRNGMTGTTNMEY